MIHTGRGSLPGIGHKNVVPVRGIYQGFAVLYPCFSLTSALCQALVGFLKQPWKMYSTLNKLLPHVRIQSGEQGSGPPLKKSQKYRVSWQYCSRSPEKSQSYQASNQC